MAKREKKPVIAPLSLEQAEQIMSEYAMLDARLSEITARMDQKITQIREQHQDDLQQLADKRQEKLTQLQLFAETNKQLFDKKKSIDMAHGILGFRTGTPKLKTIKGFTWPAITNLLKKALPDYVRTVEEPAKDKLLADRDKPEVKSLFNKDGIGCEVVQDETFFVELKKEEFAQKP
ncbi:MAG: host-nuclease inhibitor Gam family protein [Bacteroidales bacterium]|jgi:phage host-nuclease inhibitor protein Gam|nr:host-nuclease inhibitor Gam family protein [Bacteroidales bacterium]